MMADIAKYSRCDGVHRKAELSKLAIGFAGLSDDAARFANVAAASSFNLSRSRGNKLHYLLRDLAVEEDNAEA